uniref:Eph LBD domain-containing protein n=1 Tax=Syphacia muris TaxID=451379 RepID=A0A0N5A942_9BILA
MIIRSNYFLLTLCFFFYFVHATAGLWPIPPSHVRDLTVERLYGDQIFCFFKQPLWPNGVLQDYQITVSFNDTSSGWNIPAIGDNFKFQLIQNISKSHDFLMNVGVTAVNQYGTGRKVSKSFHSRGLTCDTKVKVLNFDESILELDIKTPEYCCYFYDGTCIKPLNRHRKSVRIDSSIFDSDPLIPHDYVIKIVIVDSEWGAVWDSIVAMNLRIVNGRYNVCSIDSFNSTYSICNDRSIRSIEDCECNPGKFD